MIPIILTHRGNQPYVRTAIEQAKRRNGRVVLIGDESNKDFGAEHYLNADYWQGAAEFAKVYRHMSHNPYAQELYCFQIYFVLRDFCRAQGIERLFTMDSDVMLYCDVTEYEKTLGDYDLAINWCERQEPYRWSACLHNSFWKLPILEATCRFMEGVYGNTISHPIWNKLVEKWAWHRDNNVPGGLCDMTLLHFFRQGRKAVNLSEVRNGSVWDDNINQGENYYENEYSWCPECGVKEMNGKPYTGWNKKLEQMVRFNALHFQGQAKGRMEDYKG